MKTNLFDFLIRVRATIMDVEKLIVCVQSKNPLWNQKCKDYHNRNMIKRLWEEVGEEMNNTGKYRPFYKYKQFLYLFVT